MHTAAPQGEPARFTSRQQFNLTAFRRRQRRNSVIRKISLIVECSRIVKITRQLHLRREPNALTVMKDWQCPAWRHDIFAFFADGHPPRRVNTQPHAGPHLRHIIRDALDLFRLHIERLANFTHPRRLQPSIASDVRGNFKRFAIGIALNARIESRRVLARLNTERAAQKERSQNQHQAQHRTPPREKSSCQPKRDHSHYPPQNGPPQIHPHPNTASIRSRGPQHGLASRSKRKSRRSRNRSLRNHIS